MNEPSPRSSKIGRGRYTVAQLLIGLSLLWYFCQVIKFGFAFDLVDLIGVYFVLTFIGIIIARRTSVDTASDRSFLVYACAQSIIATVLFFGMFLGTFDPFYEQDNLVWSHFLRGLLLAASLASSLAFDPRRFFVFPKWLLIVVCVIVAGWLFVFACPSIVREWYGTRSEPTEMFPEGILYFDRKNPEREIQGPLFVASLIAILILLISGRMGIRQGQKRDPVEASIGNLDN